jgi:hypothetical protein
MIDAPEVSEPDAAIDASPAGRVDVHVYSLDGRGIPDPDAVAIFLDPSGGLVQDETVDANGEAHADLPAGSTVMVIQAFREGTTQSATITTFRAIGPGDQLVVGDPPGGFVGATVDTMTVTFSPPPLPTDAATVYGPCGAHGNDGPIALPFYTACQPATFDLLAVAGSQATPTPVYIWQTGNTHMAGGTISLPGTWQPMSAAAVSLANVPDLLSSVSVQAVTRVSGRDAGLGAIDILDPDPGAHAATVYYPSAVGATAIGVETRINGRDSESLVRFTAGSLATQTMDFGALPLTRPEDVVWSPTGLTWSETGVNSADARLLEWNGRWVDDGDITYVIRERLIEPWSAASGTSATLPALPSAHAELDPTVSAFSVEPTPPSTVTYVAYSHLDYDALRGHGWQLAQPYALFQNVDHDAHVSRSYP